MILDIVLPAHLVITNDGYYSESGERVIDYLIKAINKLRIITSINPSHKNYIWQDKKWDF